MAQYYPGTAGDMALNSSGNGGSLVVPPEENFNTPAMQGSLQQFLADNLGEYVVVEFLIGTNALTRKQGVLYSVGRSVLTLYEETSQTFVVCDIFSVKFVTFYLPGQRPYRVPAATYAPGSMYTPSAAPMPGVAMPGTPSIPGTGWTSQPDTTPITNSGTAMGSAACPGGFCGGYGVPMSG
ncbi:hypothetical protein WMO64_00705 [Pseudoflavonifractor sp. CLA-AP-H29]|uniref:Spore coat protein GerQ n=1 Tax=Pseudoflavonifractor intestinihominis TaxID=3133171 RepID=A0ABV1E6A6_9FIRM